MRNVSADHSPRNHSTLLLLLILLAGFFLRVWQLGKQSLWYDEGVTAWLAQMPIGEMVQWTADDIQPPLAYLLVAGWGRVAGWSEFALRFVSAFFSTLAIALYYALASTWTRRIDKRCDGATGNFPLWVALIAAVHPLYVYYAQEARMYAQLGTLIVLGAWLLAPPFFGAMTWRRWLAYATVMALAAYTHYFAFFALLAFAAAWIWQQWSLPSGARRQWTHFLAANALTVALFAPWLGVMLQRLGDDASYWEGNLRTIEAVRDVAQRFVTGETMREAVAVPIATAILAATAILLLFVWRRHTDLRPLLRFALCWLVIPVIAVIALASTAPKFNPRYVYMALGGLVLIWGALLSALTSRKTASARWVALGAVVLLFAPMLWANGNWYFNGNFNKAQWREITEYLRPRLTSEERVILVSGHAFPVWNYYAPDIPVVRLPAIDVLDVDAVLTFDNTADALRTALADHPGAWLVQWQEEVVDPNDVVLTQLELGGREKGLTATFNQLELDRFSQIRTPRISDTPPISQTLNAHFRDSVQLNGYRPLDNGDLLLFWSLPAATVSDYMVSIEVLDGAGMLLQRVPDRRLAGYNYPTFRWRTGDVNMGRIAVEDWLGHTLAEFEEGTATPEPVYQLRLRVYDALDPKKTPLPLIDGSDALLLTDLHPILE